MPATATVAKDADHEVVLLLPVAQCHKSPTQPRKRNGDNVDEEFISSIRQKGVIQPIVVRVRAAGGWEVVFGHRRHQGSIAAERSTIPAIVRDITDEEVFEAQLIENVHRQDMHPLDEADGFKRMVDGGRTAAEVAARVGREVTYVAQRLKLCSLGKECRKALDEETISLGVAVLLARVPPSLQADALRSCNRWDNVAQTKKHLEQQYLLRLDQAPFALTDATLVAKAGACAACPKRTGQQRELFPDVARADMCTDPVCYRGKLDALWQVKVKAAKTGGTPILEVKDVQRALSYAGSHKKLDDEEYVNGKYVTVRKLLGKELPPVSLARDERTGAIHEVVSSADVAKILKKKNPAEDRFDSQTGMRKSEEKRLKIKLAAVEIAIGQAVDKVGVLARSTLMRVVTHALVERTWDEAQKTIARRRGLDAGKAKKVRGEQLEAHLRKMTKPEEVDGLALELALRQVGPAKWKPADQQWGEVLRALKVDFAAIERNLAAEAKAKKKPAKKRPAP